MMTLFWVKYKHYLCHGTQKLTMQPIIFIQAQLKYNLKPKLTNWLHSHKLNIFWAVKTIKSYWKLLIILKLIMKALKQFKMTNWLFLIIHSLINYLRQTKMNFLVLWNTHLVIQWIHKYMLMKKCYIWLVFSQIYILMLFYLRKKFHPFFKSMIFMTIGRKMRGILHIVIKKNKKLNLRLISIFMKQKWFQLI